MCENIGKIITYTLVIVLGFRVFVRFLAPILLYLLLNVMYPVEYPDASQERKEQEDLFG